MTPLVDFVQYNIPDWNAGTAELDALEEHVYRKLCDDYQLFDGQLRDDDRSNARRAKLSTQKYRKIKQRLVDLGKIEWRDGLFWNKKAEKVLEKTLEKSEKAREKAEKRWHRNKPKSLETNKPSDAVADAAAYAAADANLLTGELEEPLPCGNGAPALPDKQFYSEGKKLLGPKAGGFLTKLLVSQGRDIDTALAVLREATGADDPAEYIGAVVRNGTTPDFSHVFEEAEV